MRVTIIKQDGCTECAAAVDAFAKTGLYTVVINDWSEIEDQFTRAEMMADLAMKDGDSSKFPVVFVDTSYIKDWEEYLKKQKMRYLLIHEDGSYKAIETISEQDLLACQGYYPDIIDMQEKLHYTLMSCSKWGWGPIPS